jgi:peroxiredoxin
MTNIPQRVLLGPGPSDVSPRVLAAMAQPTVGHLDPVFLQIMDDVRSKMRQVFKTANGYQKWLTVWEQTPEGKTVKAMKGYSRSTKPEKDGRFSISDVPQGKYTLIVEAYANSNPKSPVGLTAGEKRRKLGGGLLDSTIREFDIPPLPGVDTNKPLDLGSLEIVASTGPKVGDPAPDFTCETLDGKQLALRDYRGKFLLLVFWVKNYGPYDRESTALKAVWEKYGKRPDFAMINLSMDSDKETPGKFIKENAMDWPQGYLGNRGDNKTAPKYGVYGFPAIMLIAPDGRVLEKDLGIDDIAGAVDRALKGMQPAK